jgi:hypothetical protein
VEASDDKGLTREEDDSLRRLAWFADTVGLSPWAKTRVDDLRRRDRRAEVRPPREEVIAECAADILSRAELPQPAQVLTGAGQRPAGGMDDPALTGSVRGPAGVKADPLVSAQTAAEVASITALRPNKRKRNPWSFRRAKGS